MTKHEAHKANLALVEAWELDSDNSYVATALATIRRDYANGRSLLTPKAVTDLAEIEEAAARDDNRGSDWRADAEECAWVLRCLAGKLHEVAP